MLICAISDLHGRFPVIPPCDVLLIAGDICPDMHRRACNDVEIMRAEQTRWLNDEYYEWEQTLPTRHIFATFGNHDWVVRMPRHVNTRLFIDEAWEHDGKRFYFTPWVAHCGDWNFQLDRAGRKVRFADIPAGLDVLVAHSPAHGVMDKAYNGDVCGCPELRQMVQIQKPKVMVHGHIHEGQRWGKHMALGKTSVYNVSMWGDWSPTTFVI